MDGLWNSNSGKESLLQGELIRHRVLTVNTATPTTGPALSDQSGFAKEDPNTFTFPVSSRGPEGGPHFVMSPRTPDVKPTFGFEVCLTQKGIVAGNQAVAAAGGFTLTAWVMAPNTTPGATSTLPLERPLWMAFEPLTGVGLNELFHSFDINSETIRFQISNIDTDGMISIVFSEL